jgi:hypothetical protein
VFGLLLLLTPVPHVLLTLVLAVLLLLLLLLLFPLLPGLACWACVCSTRYCTTANWSPSRLLTSS